MGHAKIQYHEAICGEYLDRVLVTSPASKKIRVIRVASDNKRITLACLVVQREHEVAIEALAFFRRKFDPLCRAQLEVLKFRIKIHQYGNACGRVRNGNLRRDSAVLEGQGDVMTIIVYRELVQIVGCPKKLLRRPTASSNHHQLRRLAVLRV